MTNPTLLGWTCPQCKSSFAPFVTECIHCSTEALSKAMNRRRWEKLALVEAMMKLVDLGRQQSIIAPFTYKKPS